MLNYLINIDLQLDLFDILKLSFLHSSVAQLVEQLTVNQLVAGSSPARGAKKNFNKIFT